MRKSLTKIFWNIEVWAVQKHVNLVDLVKSFPTNIFFQILASIQKRTSPIKFAPLAEKSENGSTSNLSTKSCTAAGPRYRARWPGRARASAWAGRHRPAWFARSRPDRTWVANKDLLEVEIWSYLKYRNINVPWNIKISWVPISLKAPRKLLHLGKIPKLFGPNLAEVQQNSGKILILHFLSKISRE